MYFLFYFICRNQPTHCRHAGASITATTAFFYTITVIVQTDIGGKSFLTSVMAVISIGALMGWFFYY
ncbi:hypothetical protein [Psychrobacter sp. FDAARGOS_221]|uniref:hypothetical protein n=1 Tax=Psychrobacter sp. FDAARGOS_221 TaxID=1975705 RepID=UPI000BB53062|nr:hypothetical protein [Psychrobacter sp. FDAARGOS_221]PNK60707.1 hypothetical protein A6J60_007355 [Psychrobacter sp. FDAARGOS_221]